MMRLITRPTLSAISLYLITAVIATPDSNPNFKRQEAATTSTITGEVNSSTTSTSPESQPTEIFTGVFTADGVYRITSQSGYITIAGHSLTLNGGDVMVGGVRVSVASGGAVVAGGTSIALREFTAASTTAAETTSSSAGLTLVSDTVPMRPTGTAPTDGMATSAAGAEANVKRIGAGMAVLGGLGAMLL